MFSSFAGSWFWILSKSTQWVVESDSKFKTFDFVCVLLIDLLLLCTDGSSGSDRNNSESEPKPKAIPRKEAPPRPAQSAPASAASAHQNVWIPKLESLALCLVDEKVDEENKFLKYEKPNSIASNTLIWLNWVGGVSQSYKVWEILISFPAKHIHCEWFLLSLDDFVGILQRQREQKDFDSEKKLATARKRLQENYKEAENGLVICFLRFYNNNQ